MLVWCEVHHNVASWGHMPLILVVSKGHGEMIVDPLVFHLSGPVLKYQPKWNPSLQVFHGVQ